MRTVPSDADVLMTATGELTHHCPFVDEVDNGHVTITWRTSGQSLELHALKEYLDGWRQVTASHEDVTDRIRHDLATVAGIELVSVDTTWHTADMEVRCFTSPTRADLPS